MKRLITALGFLVLIGAMNSLVFFAGCSNDDEEPDQVIDMVGFWTVSEVEISEISVGTQSIVDFFVNVGGMSQQEAEITHTFLESMIKASISGTIDIRADHTYTSVLGGETENGTWTQSVDGKTFTIYDTTDDEFEATIITLTETNANISFIYDTYQDLDQDPVTPDILLTVKGTILLIQ